MDVSCYSFLNHQVDPGTIDAFADIVDGKYDDYPEQAFFMCGGIEDVKAKAEEIKKNE